MYTHASTSSHDHSAASAAKHAYRASKSTNHYTGFGARPLTHLQHTSRKKDDRAYIKTRNAGIIDHRRNKMASFKELCDGLPIDPLPSPRDRDNSVPHAPVRAVNLSADERRV